MKYGIVLGADLSKEDRTRWHVISSVERNNDSWKVERTCFQFTANLYSDEDCDLRIQIPSVNASKKYLAIELDNSGNVSLQTIINASISK